MRTTVAAIVMAMASVVSLPAGQRAGDLPLSMRPTLSMQRVCVLDDRLYAVEFGIRTAYRNAGTAPIELVPDTEIFESATYAREEMSLETGRQAVDIGDLVVLPADAEGPWSSGQTRHLEPGETFEGRTGMVMVVARPDHQPDAKDATVLPGPGFIRVYTRIVGRVRSTAASEPAFAWHSVTGAIAPITLPPLRDEGSCG